VTTSRETGLHAGSNPPRADKGYKGLGMEGFLARWYAKNTGKNRQNYREAAETVAGRLPGSGSVLEVAPGPGYLAIELAQLGSYRIVGLDVSHTFVEIARRNAQEAGVAVTFEQGNASAMPFEPDSFDFVVCTAAFKNFSEPVRAIEEMHRVLRPGGTALIGDLRPDAPPEAIDAEIKKMKPGRLNAWVIKLTFKHMLLKRAHTREEFRQMVARTPFKTCDIQEKGIALFVWLTKER
jgi:ubiquinone/menaquinone biosynthesis C-methylase UbiE